MVSYDGTFKILLLSDPEVDKSAMIWGNIPLSDEQLIIGVKWILKIMGIDDKRYKLQLWDFTGEKRWQGIIPRHYPGANAAVLLYDVTISQTLDNIGEWVKIVREKCGEIPIMLVGILPDEKSERRVSAEEGKEIAKTRNLNGFIECNSKTGENVEIFFEGITRLILANRSQIPPLRKAEDLSKPNYLIRKKRLYSESDFKSKSKGLSPKIPSKPPSLPPPPRSSEKSSSEPFFNQRARSLLGKLEKHKKPNSRIVDFAIFRGMDSLLYSTENWKAISDTAKIFLSIIDWDNKKSQSFFIDWESKRPKFFVISGVKYEILKRTSDLFVANSVKGACDFVGVKEGDLILLAYITLNGDNDHLGIFCPICKKKIPVEDFKTHSCIETMLDTAGALSQLSSSVSLEANIDPQLKGEVQSFLEWIKDNEGLSGYINYYLQQNNTAIISVLSKIYTDLRQIFGV